MSIVARLASRLGLLAFVAAGLVSVGPMNEAHAVCTTIGLTVICTGNTPGGFGDGSQDNLNITVQPAARSAAPTRRIQPGGIRLYW